MERWADLFNRGELNAKHFRAYWMTVVPSLLAPQPGSNYLNQSIDEEAIKTTLLDPLESFLFDCLWPQASQELRASEKPPVRCGKVFKVGEPTYSCRDCGADPTCVLCVDCFKTSGHQSHRYRMSTSFGGGYCDCGDTEAWRNGAFCETHRESNENLESDGDAVSRLPPQVITKGKIVMEAVVAYCYQMILWDLSLVLPDDLRAHREAPTNDSYVTLLYNDEIHTYDQVIRALVRNIGCSSKEAIELATLVDREGRSVIRCGCSRDCNIAKDMVEKFTAHHIPKPLRVVVMHADVLAHQNFALRLLVWVLQLTNHSRGFRLLFGDVVFREGSSGGKRSIVESIMDYDTRMWKSARSIWHQLFISGLLMESNSKQKFSRLYARNYSSIIKDFVEDDHEQTLSITSLSVQLFTVPSLAHMLIAEEDIIAILLHTFNTESESKLNGDGKLAFVRSSPDIAFKRACCVLNDLFYLVNTPPKVWTGALRRNFLHGFSIMLELLSRIHGMDAAVRQVGQHVEFEPEWETAFSLHLRLGGTVSMMVEWCSTDRTVLIKAYRAVMKKLALAIGKQTYIVHKVAEHTVSCIDYDVSVQPVSIHLSLCGLLSGLHLHLERHDLSYDSPELAWSDKPSPVSLMELPLRTQVMMAQVHAGMWRRNGYSLLNQIFFYRNVRYRTEIYDRDIISLQIGASLMDANDFIIHLLNKFGLIQWVWEDYTLSDGQTMSVSSNAEDDGAATGNQESRSTGAKGRQVSSLAEDFLGLIITVVSERYVKGVGQVTTEDCVKKEVIQQLSIEPMSHSQLVKALPEDANSETGLERVIDQVATFKKPPGSSKGLYELLPEAHKHFDPFYYHYSREEQSKAEEYQRKRVRNPAVEGSEDTCLPPPVPPPFSRPFSSIVNILCCDVMLKIMRLTLERTAFAANCNGVPPTDGEIQRVLHLIGYALHEEQRSLEAGNLFFQFTKRASKENILELLESLVASPVTSKQVYQIPHRDLCNWTLRKFRLVKRNHVSLAEESGIGEGSKREESMVVEEGDMKEVNVDKSDEKRRRAELAMARRARIMAQMADMQKSFISAHANLFEGASFNSISSSGSAMDLTESEERPKSSVCLGRKCGSRAWSRVVHTCILCQEEETVSSEGRPLVFSVLVQKSTVLSQLKGDVGARELPQIPLLPPLNLRCALYTSTCGHVMHADCWKKYFEIVANKERRRSLRIRQHISFDVNKQEFLCPLCECLSNAVIPILPPVNYSLNSAEMELSVDVWIKLMQDAFYGIKTKECFGGLIKWPEEQQQLMDAMRTFPLDEINVSPGVMEMVQIFAKAIFMVGLHSNASEEDPRIVPIAIYACFYTIRVIEMSLRDAGKPTFGELSSRQSDAINALVGFSSTCCRLASSVKMEGHLKTVLNILFLDKNLDANCFLKVDAFGLLLSLIFVSPVVFGHTGFVIETTTLRVVYVIHALQIVATAKLRSDSEMVEEEANTLVDVYKLLHPGCGPVSSAVLQKEIEQRSIPFLRCCALFFHNLTGVTPPEELCQLKSDLHLALCNYMALEPNVSLILEKSVYLRTLVRSWVNNPATAAHLLDSHCVGPSLEINQLYTLPLDYSELINEAACFTCPNSDREGSRVPTLCLICGHILCSQSYCCQSELNGTNVGACTFHAHRCGAGVGMFLRIRECKVLLLASQTKGCFIPPPYLDRYGETDQGLRRGNPLYLCHDSYKKLNRMWLNHGIMEEIAHSLESAHYVSAVEWQHL